MNAKGAGGLEANFGSRFDLRPRAIEGPGGGVDPTDAVLPFAAMNSDLPPLSGRADPERGLLAVSDFLRSRGEGLSTPGLAQRRDVRRARSVEHPAAWCGVNEEVSRTTTAT